MKKDRNSQDQPKPDYSLPRSKILRGRRNYQRLFEKSTVLNSNSLQFRYRIYQDPREGCFIGFIAPKKKIRGAVKRNRVKRLLREVYRMHQQTLQDLFAKQTFGFHGAFIANKPEVTFDNIRDEMLPMLKNVHTRLQKMGSMSSDKRDAVHKSFNSKT
jgi:ribonuclease P protein component